MALFFAMLPIYIFGNLHCLGMCGPLVMMLGQHPHRYYYFLGRTLSYTMAGGTAGAIGAVADTFFRRYHISFATTLIFGFLLMMLGISSFTGWRYPGYRFLSKQLFKISQNLSLLLLQERRLPTFLFGFFTVALPCGQTLIVFSACALSGSILEGTFNGAVFALLTSPSLALAMQASSALQSAKKYYQAVIGISALVVGTFAILRGLAEIGLISHWVINPNSPSYYHIVIF